MGPLFAFDIFYRVKNLKRKWRTRKLFSRKRKWFGLKLEVILGGQHS